MKNLGSILLVLLIAGLPVGIIGCKADSKSNPVAPISPYATEWFPLAEGIASVWENYDYDAMGMAGMMYADTSVAHMRMRGNDMWYD